jgi:hypothetical protein
MRYILVSLFILYAIPGYCADRVIVQVQFRKALWQCPGGDEVTDLNVGTPSVYEHTCSDNTWLNSFKEYNGTLRYTPDEFEKADSTDKAKAKQEAFDKWVYEIKHPVPYVEPQLSDYINIYNERIQDAQQYLDKIAEKGSKQDLEVVKANLDAKVADVAVKIQAKIVVEPIVEPIE